MGVTERGTFFPKEGLVVKVFPGKKRTPDILIPVVL